MCRKLIYLISFVLVLSLAGNVANADLVAAYTFEGNLDDVSGNGHNGTIMGDPAVYVVDVFGRAIALDGDDYVELSNPEGFNFETDFTWVAWVKTTDNGTIIARAPATGDWATGGKTLILRNDMLGIDIGWVGYYGSGLTVSDGEWHHVAATTVFETSGENDTTTLYVDGSPAASSRDWNVNAYSEAGLSVKIGFTNGNFPDPPWYNGLIDDVGIFDTALTEEEINQVMETGIVEVEPTLASNPDPADKATDVCPKVVLSWTPGAFVGALSPKHKVFLSEDFNDVNDGVGGVTQDPNRYPATGTLSLDFGKTYYWKVDEANSTTGWDEGGIWQFTIEPFAYPIAGDEITATASGSNSASEGPENTINGSGLDANDLHSTETTDMWLSSDEPNGAWIEYEFDKVYKLHEMWVWNHNSPFEGDLGYGLKDVTIEYSENGADYTTLGTTHEFARAPGAPGYEHNTEVYFGVPAKYVKLTSNSNWGFLNLDNYGLSEVRFFRIPVRAGEESPESGTTIDGIDVVLSWRPGREAAEHNVYFSTSFEDVNTGTIAPDIIDAADGCRASYGPLSLDLDKTYYWKVNEVNLAEEPSTWPGDVWNFTTPEYLVVDDMEAHTGRQSIRYVWHDGYVAGIAPSGSNVTVSTESDDRDPRLAGVGPPWPVRGSEAMQFAYDNDGSITLYVPGYAEYTYSANANYYSEIEASTSGPNSLEVGRNWASAKALSLWFYGNPNNAAEEMYVKLNGSKVVYDGDAGDVQQAGWHEWNIVLSDFGVDLQNVTMVYIGFGDENNTTTPGGSGVVYFDDIRLYPTRCVLSLRSDDFARVDYVRDCVVDYKEVEVMAENWLHEVFYSYYEDFDSYFVGFNMHDADGWEGWYGDADAGGYVTDAQAYSGNYSLEFVIPVDAVPHWERKTSGSWILTTMQYVPSTATSGSAHYGVLSGYVEADLDWIAEVVSDFENNVVFLTDLDPEPELPLVRDDWAEIRVEVDFDSQVSNFYYNGELLGTHGADQTTGLEGIDLWAQSDDVIYFDDIMLDSLTLRGADLSGDDKINFKDFAELAAWWLDEVLWP